MAPSIKINKIVQDNKCTSKYNFMYIKITPAARTKKFIKKKLLILL